MTRFPTMALAVGLALGVTAFGAATFGAAAGAVAQSQMPMYGSQMMTEQERKQFHDRMRNSESVEEREKFRTEHRDRMRSRALERGMTPPDDPPARGMGPGDGRMPGSGMGPGGRMSPGSGMGPGGKR